MGWLQSVGQSIGNNVSSGANQFANGWGQVAQGNIGQGFGNVLGGTGNMTTGPAAGLLGMSDANGTGNGLFDNPYGPIPGTMGSSASGTSAPTDPYAGIPQLPGYVAPYNPATMNPVTAYNQEEAANDQGINQLKNLATTPGNSPWANAAMTENQANVNAQLDKGAQQVQGAKDTNDAGLAMQGGLSEGARERGAESANTGFMNMSQNANQQGTLNNLNIEKQDQANKLTELGTLTGDQQQQVQGYMGAENSANQMQMANTQGQNQYNMGAYQTNAGIAAAGQMATATQNSGKQSVL